jgi:hypothetical protein
MGKEVFLRRLLALFNRDFEGDKYRRSYNIAKD